MRLFVTGSWCNRLVHIQRREAAAQFEHWVDPTTEMVVVTAAHGLDSFAAAYFHHRKIPVTIVTELQGPIVRDRQILVELDIDFAFIAGWAYDWRQKMIDFEVQHCVLWESLHPMPPERWADVVEEIERG